MKLDYELTRAQRAEMARIPAEAWFTQVRFRNGESPVHPDPKLLANNDFKLALIDDWIKQLVAGRRVLDLFSATARFRSWRLRLAHAKSLGWSSQRRA